MFTKHPMWTVLTITAALGLVLFWSDRQGPVRGSLTIGIIAGLIAATVYFFLGDNFEPSIAGKWIVVIVLIAFAQEVLRRLRKRLYR